MKGLSNLYNTYNKYLNSNLSDIYTPYNEYYYGYYYNNPLYLSSFMTDLTRQYISSSNNIDCYTRYDLGENTNTYTLPNLKDYGPNPFVINIEDATKANSNFRTTLWTGQNLQLTLMTINVGEDIGLESHPHLDQFIRIEEGEGLVKMGSTKDNLDFQKNVSDGFAIFIPAGKWHNLINTGYKPIKLYSIYAPPQHPYNTVHETKEIAEASEQ